MGKRFSDEDIARYRNDGFFFPLTIMTGEAAAAHRRALEAAEARKGPMHYRTKPYLVFASAWEIARHPVLLDAVEDILGPDILIYDSAYVIKEPRNTRYVSWHQDLTYWGLSADDVVTAWVALTPATPANGAMRFIPGSHTNGRLAHHDTRAADNILHRGQEVRNGFDESAAIDGVLAAGQVSLHHGWTLHASHGNTTDDRRIGLTLQYVAPTVRQTLSDRESATLVRGEDRYGHFQPEPAFAGDFQPEAVAFQHAAEALKHEIYDTA